MKTRTLSILTIAASVGLTASPLFAQATAVTAPVGYRTETITGGVFTLMSPNLLPPVSAAGDLESAVGTTLTDAEADFSALPAGNYVLKLTSGANVGVTAEVSGFPTATTMTTVQDISSMVAATDLYELRAAQTVSSIFGATNDLGLTAGTTATADIVWIPNGTGGFVRVYYNAAANGWRFIGALGDASGAAIFFSDGILIQNQSGASKDLVFTGHVSPTPTTVAVDAPPLFTFLSRVLPVEISLDNSELGAQMTAGAQAVADVIWNPNGAGGYDRYFFNAGSWRKIGSLGTFGGDLLQSGFIVQRQTGDAGNLTFNIPANLDL